MSYLEIVGSRLMSVSSSKGDCAWLAYMQLCLAQSQIFPYLITASNEVLQQSTAVILPVGQPSDLVGFSKQYSAGGAVDPLDDESIHTVNVKLFRSELGRHLPQ
jgi:hypothetical protein